MTDSSTALPLRVVQIIVGVMIAGVLVFASVAAVVDPLAHQARDALGMDSSPAAGPLLLACGALAVMGVPAYLLVRRNRLAALASRRAEAKDEVRAGRLPSELSTLTIVGAALAEGVGLLGCVTRLVTGEPWALAFPVLAILAMAALIPTRARIEEMVSRTP